MKLLEERLLEKVKASPLWKKGERVIAACSGGADSLTLTDIMARAALADDMTVIAVHVQHHIRGEEAEADACFTASFCRARHLEFRRYDVYPGELASRKGISLESAARQLRYDALERCRRETRAVGIFLAHHRDDQAETVLLNLLRGSGLRGLRGMLPVHGYLARPFLDMTRQDMEQYCRDQGIQFRTDSTNADTNYRRNWVRKVLLPLLEQQNPQIRRELAQTAVLAARDEACLEEWTLHYLLLHGKKIGTSYELDVGREFHVLPVSLQDRVLRHAVWEMGGREAGYGHIERIRLLILKGIGGKVLDVPGNIRISYRDGRLSIGQKQRSRQDERAAKLAKKEQQRNATQY
jgi:tRNA(Ile)-lysidine synthase